MCEEVSFGRLQGIYAASHWYRHDRVADNVDVWLGRLQYGRSFPRNREG